MSEKLIIIGSGPAGYTAAIYASRANLAPLLFEGKDAGGQLMTTTDVENYPGFPDGVLGPDLMQLFKKQAERFGAKIIADTVTAVDFSKRPFQVMVDKKIYEAKSIIISTGAVARRLGLESEKALFGKGVSACATCDGPLFTGKEVMVVGGGDAAMEEASFLTKFATRVTILVRGNALRASKIMQDRAKNNPKIEFVWNTEVAEVLAGANGMIRAVKLKNNKTGEEREAATGGLFVAIGHEPATALFKGQVALDRVGYVVTKNGTSATSVPGVFAGGDVADYRYRQAVTAAGTGCMAAMDAEKFLESVHH